MLDTTKKEMAIQILHRNWDEVIAGEVECEGIAECHIKGLKSQILKDEQGWDMSAEDFDEEIAAIVGLDTLEDHEEEWESIVDEAAKRYLTAHGIEWEGLDV